MPTAEAWLVAFAARIGVPAPTDEERTALLRLASTAAHDSERRAAPIACWLAARAGLSPAEAEAAARDLAPPPEQPAAAGPPTDPGPSPAPHRPAAAPPGRRPPAG